MKNNPSLKSELEEKMKDNSQSIVFARLADLYLSEERIDEAIQLCKDGVAAHPFYVTGYYILAKAYLLKNELENSESALKKVLSHDREYISAYKHLGDIMVKLGWNNSAIAHYKDILQIDLLEKTALSAISKISNEPVHAEDLFTAGTAASEDRVNHSKKSVKEEEWISQIREVFPDELSDYVPAGSPAESAPVAEPQIDPKTEENPPVPGMDESFSTEENPSLPGIDDSFSVDKPAEISPGPSEKFMQPVAPGDPEPFSLSISDDLVEILSDGPESGSVKEPQSKTNSPDESETPAAEEVTVESVSIDWDGIQETSDLLPNPEPAEDHSPEKTQKTNVTEDTPIIDIDESDLIESIDPDTIRKPGSSPEDASFPVELPEILEPVDPENAEFSSPAVEGLAVLPMEEDFVTTVEPVPASADTQTGPENPTELTDTQPDAIRKKEEPLSSPKILTPTLGEIYIAQEQFDKAMQVYKKLSELHPEEKKYQEKIRFLEEKIKDSNI